MRQHCGHWSPLLTALGRNVRWQELQRIREVPMSGAELPQAKGIFRRRIASPHSPVLERCFAHLEFDGAAQGGRAEFEDPLEVGEQPW